MIILTDSVSTVHAMEGYGIQDKGDSLSIF